MPGPQDQLVINPATDLFPITAGDPFPGGREFARGFHAQADGLVNITTLAGTVITGLVVKEGAYYPYIISSVDAGGTAAVIGIS